MLPIGEQGKSESGDFVRIACLTFGSQAELDRFLTALDLPLGCRIFPGELIADRLGIDLSKHGDQQEEAIWAAPLPPPLPPYSVPRRFGLGAMLVVITAFSVLFSMLRAAGFNIAIVFSATAYLLTIALVQMVYPKSPRAASAIAGTCLFPVCMIVWRIVEYGSVMPSFEFLFGMVCSSCFFGPLFGYVAGTLGAGIFLLMETYAPGKFGMLPASEATSTDATTVHRQDFVDREIDSNL